MSLKGNTLRFAYLNLRENPRGNAMLQQIIREGHIPLVIIEEDSSLAKKNELALLEELNTLEPEMPLPPSLQEIVQGTDIRCVKVSNHNDEECQLLLQDLSLDVIVLGDTRIIKPNILTIPRIGIVNVHPGYLPDVRGNNPYIWAVYYDLPQGCTVHFIDKDIDTGPIIVREKIALEQGTTYPRLISILIRTCANLLAQALHAIERGDLECQEQKDLELIGPDLPTFTLAPPEVKERAKQILVEGTYRYLVEH